MFKEKGMSCVNGLIQHQKVEMDIWDVWVSCLETGRSRIPKVNPNMYSVHCVTISNESIE
jgi:hypothetical protein